VRPLRSRFFVKLFASYAALVVLNAALADFFVARWASRAQRREIEETLAAQGALLAEAVRQFPDEGALQRRVADLGAATASRLTVVAPDGRVLADSAELPERMENHRLREEFVQAAARGRGSAERVSVTTGVRTLYVCLAVGGGSDRIGFVRAAMALPGLKERLGRVRATIVAGIATGTAVALALAWFIARRVTRPLAEMTSAAVALARGDAAAPIRHESSDEVGELARALHRMSTRLSERLAELEVERAKLATVLESMAEGVVAVDSEGRLIHCNAAARALLSIPADAGGGARSLVEQVRAPELVEALRRAQSLGRGAPLVEEVKLRAGGNERAVAIHAAPLADGGAVAVLLDVTELRRLETVRRDFVANVSHEIKTPLAAMRGLVETLEDDASMEPAVRRRFLGKLADHVRRLTELATDLLHLSRAESERPAARVTVDLAAAAAAACERFGAAASARRVALRCETAPAATPADPEAVARILDNLIDNAIKFTPPGGRVTVRSAEAAGRARLEVADTGIGIEPAEQARVFERFYRVDKARSRDVPGTGLGLSIVKHLAEGHGGSVELESWPGRGSTFRVLLPLSAPPVAQSAGAEDAAPRASPDAQVPAAD
jgi:two-component system phosphate regulon sensor histidine kinase PhoR